MITIGKNIRKVRESKNINMFKLSNETGLSIDFLSDIEECKIINPRIDIVYKISRALEISVDKLVFER